MSRYDVETLVCPNCHHAKRQIPQEDDIIFCGECESTYIVDEDDDHGYGYDDDHKYRDHDDDEYEDDDDDEEEEEEDTLDDNEAKAREIADEFVLLPPIDYKSEPFIESDIFNFMSDDDTKSTTKKKSRSKPKEKKPTTPRRKIIQTTARDSTKLPSIFRDDILSTVKRNSNDAFGDDDDELAFSDLSDQEGVNDLHHTTRDQQNYSRQTRPSKGKTFSDSEPEDEEEEEVITVITKKKKNPRTVKEEARTNTKGTMPFKQYSPFIQFNKEMRGKLAEKHREALEMSGEPQKELTRLVADAWKAMPKTKKDEFKQKLKDDKDFLKSIAKQKTPRPTGNGYILYSKTKLPQIKADYPNLTKIRELSVIVGQHWKELDDNEKEEYKAKAKQEQEDWIKENPELHQQYLDKMATKIRATKKARREEKIGAST